MNLVLTLLVTTVGVLVGCWQLAKFQYCENLVFVFARYDRRLIAVLTPRITYTGGSLVTASLHHKSIVFVIITILR